MPVIGLKIALALIAGGIQGVITLRWYEPPPHDDEVPSAIPEALLFTVVFAGIFAGYAHLLSFLATSAPPVTEYVLIVISLVGIAVSYGVFTGRLTSDNTVVEEHLATVSAVVFATFPLVILAI